MPIPSSYTLLDKVTTNVTGSTKRHTFSNAVVHGSIVGSGSVSVTVSIEGSIRGTVWLALGSLSLTGTGSDSDSLEITEPWPLLRAKTASISGTGATVNVDVAGV